MLITANVLVFVIIAAAAGAAGYAINAFGEIHRETVKDLVTGPSKSYVIINHKKVNVIGGSKLAPFTILLVGSDSRAGAVGSGFKVGSSTTQSENLSDSIILARVAPATHQMALLSIPRDLWVSIPGVGDGKINAAFAGGDPSRLIEVIEKDLGLPVNHFAEVSFDAFEQIADAVGGVEQYFPTPARDAYSGLDVAQAGCVELRGDQALAFVRSRHYEYYLDGQWQSQEEPESDLGRIQRQQAFIKNATEKIERSGDLEHPIRLASIVTSITKNLTVDSTFSNRELISLAESFRGLNANNLPNMTYPVQNAEVDGTSALTGVPSADAAVIAKFESVGTVKRAPTSTTSTTSTASATVPGASGSSPSTSAASSSTTSTSTTSTTTTVPSAAGTIYGSDTSVTPDSSSYVHGVYIPPGRQAGQSAETCGD
jgi:LCP family protein required for cell wall assembly